MQWHLKLLNYLFRRRSKKTSKLTSLCAGNSPVTGEFPTQKASKAENVSIWWRHHDVCSGVIEVSVMYTPSGCALNTNPINTLILSTCYISWLKLILQWRLNLVLNYDNMPYCTYKNKRKTLSIGHCVQHVCYLYACPCRLIILLLGNIDVSTLPDLTNECLHQDTKNCKLKLLHIFRHHISSWKLIKEFK